ncbi:MAG: hypothetical protein QOJ60_464 [Actinomycetota bacterium]|jgi:hypothetical protein|nr:hypothetical protein [Actinomycetota bacterium]
MAEGMAGQQEQERATPHLVGALVLHLDVRRVARSGQSTAPVEGPRHHRGNLTPQLWTEPTAVKGRAR